MCIRDRFIVSSSFLNDSVNTYDIELKIKSDRDQIEPHLNPNHYANITGELTNNGSKSIKLVLPGDGSDNGWRTPYIKWSVVEYKDAHINPHEFKFQGGMRCGNVNSLKSNDIIELLPNQSVTLDEWIGYPQIPHKSGKYMVRLY